MTNPTERELTDKLADALEAMLNDFGMMSHASVKGAIEALEAYRAQRDGEREPKMCSICFGSGKWKFHGGEQECPGCKGAGKIAPLAKGEA